MPFGLRKPRRESAGLRRAPHRRRSSAARISMFKRNQAIAKNSSMRCERAKRARSVGQDALTSPRIAYSTNSVGLLIGAASHRRFVSLNTFIREEARLKNTVSRAATFSRWKFKVMWRILAIRQSVGFQQMATAKMSGEALFAFLDAHPNLRDRMASIISAIDDSEGNLKEADAAEERIIEEMQLLGREALQGWADKQVERTEREIRQQPHMYRQGEKKSAGIRKSAISRS